MSAALPGIIVCSRQLFVFCLMLSYEYFFTQCSTAYASAFYFVLYSTLNRLKHSQYMQILPSLGAKSVRFVLCTQLITRIRMITGCQLSYGCHQSLSLHCPP